MKHINSKLRFLPLETTVKDYILPLVIASIAGFFVWQAIGTLQMQRDYAVLINLSGRERMLSQRLYRDATSGPFSEEQKWTTLKELTDINSVLRNGGVINSTVLKKPTDPSLIVNLEEQAKTLEELKQLMMKPHTEQWVFVGKLDDVFARAESTVQIYLGAMRKSTTHILNIGIVLFIFLTLLALLLNRLILDRRHQLHLLEAARNEALQALSAKSQFLANVSHEIRTPLNAIVGMSEALNRSNLADDQKGYLKTLHRAGQTLSRLLNDILDFAKLERGHIDLVDENFDVADVLQSSVQPFLQTAQQKQIDLRIAIEPNVPHRCCGDALRLQQILMHLISNAVRFTNKGSVVVSVAAKTESSEAVRLEFKVTDTGIGIDPSQLNSIFESFAQANGSIGIQFGGTGLGLAVCNLLVQRMHGSIIVESELGRGSTFTFSVLAKEAQRDESEAEPQKDIAPKRHLLVVDDVEDNRFVIRSYFNDSPYIVDEACSGDEAIAKVRENSYDLIFMDIRMSPKDGYATTRELRDLEVAHSRSRTPIVAVTAHTSPEEIDLAIASGCDMHVGKPLLRPKLLEVINRFFPANKQDLNVIELNVEPFLRPRLAAYVENRNVDLLTLHKEIRAQNFEEVGRLGHNISGTAGMYGMDELATIARGVQASAKNRDSKAVLEMLDKMSHYLRRLRC